MKKGITFKWEQVTRRQYNLQKTLINICQNGSGTKDERYEDCKQILKEAEKEGVIKYDEYGDWIKLVVEVLQI